MAMASGMRAATMSVIVRCHGLNLSGIQRASQMQTGGKASNSNSFSPRSDVKNTPASRNVINITKTTGNPHSATLERFQRGA